MKKIIWVVSAAIFDESGMIMVTERPEGRTMAGLWEFPGGKIEQGETPENALVREMGEELGIKVATKDLSALTFVSHEYEEYQVVMLLYAIKKWSGCPEGLEGQKIKWVSIKALGTLEMPPADIPLVEFLKRCN